MDNLSYLALFWGGVYFSSVLAKRTQILPILFFIAFGSVLVNFGFYPQQSIPFISSLAELGIILIMFAIGFEEDTKHFVSSIKRSWGVAFFGALAPFAAAYYCSLLFWGDQAMAILCGLTMTATAVSLTMVSLKSVGLHKSAAATAIMSSAILDDIASLVFVAVMVPLVTGQADLSFFGIVHIVAKAVLFFLCVTFLELVLFPNEIKLARFKWLPFKDRWGIKQLLAFNNGEKTTLTVLLIAVFVGLLAHKLGFHVAVGAYMAGLILKEEYFQFHDHPKVNYFRQSKRVIDDVAFSWIGPIFFVELGTKLYFEADMMALVLGPTLFLLLAIVVAQVTSACLAARFTGHFDWLDSVMIGFGMLGRAELAFVVVDIGYVHYHILSQEAFYTLMFTIFGLNILVPVCIKWWKPFFEGEKVLRLGRFKLERARPPPS